MAPLREAVGLVDDEPTQHALLVQPLQHVPQSVGFRKPLLERGGGEGGKEGRKKEEGLGGGIRRRRRGVCV